MLIERVSLLDDLLSAHAGAIGADLTPYTNHTYRVLNFCAALTGSGVHAVEKIAVVAAFHDIGIWTAGTFDYLGPSMLAASAYLTRSGRDAWMREVRQTILDHHKLRRYREHPDWMVEPFRRADWIDVTLGVRRFGLPRSLIREAYAAWPSAGFHGRLVQLSLGRLRRHPTSPLPMVRW
jgi:hypothetical protein